MKPVGVLDLKLVQARDLKNKDLVGKSDPFALVYIRPLRNTTRKSKTIVSNRVVNYFSVISVS
jgi:Ca2+-dependent lipid-binding protein